MKNKSIRKGITIVIPSIGRMSLKNLLHSIHLDKSLRHHETIIVVNSKFFKELKIDYKEYKCLKFIAQNSNNISKSRNIGIAAAKYEIITLIDDDDLWIDGRVKIFSDFLSSTPKSIVFGSTRLINSTSGKEKTLGKTQSVDRMQYINQFKTPYLAREKYFLHVGNCAFLNKLNLPPFNEDLLYLEDQMWILNSLICGFKVFQTSELTLKYFFSRSRSNARWNIETEKEIYRVLGHIERDLSEKYINRKSLKSIALSGDKIKLEKSRQAIQKKLDPNTLNRFSILFFSLVVRLVALTDLFILKLGNNNSTKLKSSKNSDKS
jgi:glycosyltransferase involved in cell wall biosynthesis